MTRSLTLVAICLAIAAPAHAQKQEQVDAAIEKGVQLLLGMQEGDDNAEWPYEGVYRVQREIPIGYRIGGTSIVGLSLIQSPGYAEDAKSKEAVARATRFVTKGIEHPLMVYENVQATYDVRGWGYAYGLLYLLQLEKLDVVPDDQGEAIKKAIGFYLAGIQKTAIPQAGGWNYARRGGFDKPGAPSPFMTGSSLQALFQARAQGYAVDTEVVEQGLKALEKARTPAGGFVYSGFADRPEPVPGSVGRMLIAESTFLLAGRGSLDRVRGAVDAFFNHWEWLEQRRAKTGTHVRPFGVAPYYYYYAHYYAAQAIELLPEYERPIYRFKLRQIFFQVRLEDGTWNDRVFKRSANYGTALTIMALRMQDLPPPARWGEASGSGEVKKKAKKNSQGRF